MKGMEQLELCECGHVEYHHRPECTHRPSMLLASPPDCYCLEFKKREEE